LSFSLHNQKKKHGEGTRKRVDLGEKIHFLYEYNLP